MARASSGAATPAPPTAAGIEWTPANIVTMVRICLIPVFIVLMLVPWAQAIWGAQAAATIQPWCALVVYALISLTDSLDGYLARSRNEVTVFGKFMDPIADKVLVTAALIVLVQLGSVPSWIPIVIIARELLVSGLRMLVAAAGVVVAASWIGKAKTATTMVAICLFIIKDTPALAHQAWFSAIAWTLMLAAVVLTVVSMVDYFAKSWPLLVNAPTRGGAAKGSTSTTGQSPNPASLEGRHELARHVVALASAQDRIVATAESCTGGLVAGALTSVAGSSVCVAGGVVSYTPQVKEEALGVSPQTIETYGVVSEQTAAAMAQGARTTLGATLAVSTTGIAGPSGGTPQTPVGTVCFGLSTADETYTYTKRFSGSREEIRAQAVDYALQILLEKLG